MNIQAMMKQAKKMQSEMDKAMAEIAKREFVVQKQGVSVVVMGDRLIKSITIDEALIDPEDKEIIEDLVVIALNEATEAINIAEEEAKPDAGGGVPF